MNGGSGGVKMKGAGAGDCTDRRSRLRCRCLRRLPLRCLGSLGVSLKGRQRARLIFARQAKYREAVWARLSLWKDVTQRCVSGDRGVGVAYSWL